MVSRSKVYCQMCKKQCKDQRAFDDHCKGRSHISEMERFSRNPNKYITQFSNEYKESFIQTCREHYGLDSTIGYRVHSFYAQYSDHIRIHSTKWESLADFLKAMHKEGLLRVTEGPDPCSGTTTLYCQVIDIESAKKEELRQKRLQKIEKSRQTDEQALQDSYSERAAAIEKREELNQKDEDTTALVDNTQIVVGKQSKVDEKLLKKSLLADDDEADEKQEVQKKKRSKPEPQQAAAPVEADEIKWLHSGIVVKIVCKSSKLSKYYNTKGTVESVLPDGYSASIRTPTALLKLDQSHLQTVIPKLGSPVLVLTPKLFGKKGILKSIIADKFLGVVELRSGDIVKVKYEEFSKVS